MAKTLSKKCRERIHQKYGGRCGYCGREIEYKAMQVDHMLPQKRACGSLDPTIQGKVYCEDNLMPACRTCNHYKRSLDVRQFRLLLSDLHDRIAKVYIHKVGVAFGIAQIKPFDGVFYFEKHQS